MSRWLGHQPAAATEDRFAVMREFELARLRFSETVYLDYTGAAPYPATVPRVHSRLLRGQVFGNPHSTHPASVNSTAAAQHARAAMLGFLDADPAEYEVVLTSNAAGSCHLRPDPLNATRRHDRVQRSRSRGIRHRS